MTHMIRVRCSVSGCNAKDSYPNTHAAERDGWYVDPDPGVDVSGDLCPEHNLDEDEEER